MKLESQVAPLAESRRLKELGFPQDTEFAWSAWSDHAAAEGIECHELHWQLTDKEGGSVAPRCAAPTVAENTIVTDPPPGIVNEPHTGDVDAAAGFAVVGLVAPPARVVCDVAAYARPEASVSVTDTPVAVGRPARLDNVIE